MSLKHATRTAGLLAALTLCFPALAQEAASTSGANPARVEQRIAKLHAQLLITPAEEPKWEQFAGVMRGNAGVMGQAYDQRHNQLASMSAVDNLQSYAEAATQHARNMQRLAGAFQKLYAIMPDDQKKIADAVFRARSNHF